MPIAQVQKAINNIGNSGSITITLAGAPTAGNLLVLIYTVKTPSTTISIGIGGWTQAIAEGTGGTRTRLHYKLASGDAAATTIAFEEGDAMCVAAVAEYSGMAATDVLDQTGDASDTSSITSLLVTARGATTTAEELLICGVGHGGNVSVPTWTDSFTAQGNDETGSGLTHIDMQWAHRIVAAPGTYETTAGWTTGRASAGVLATFKGPTTQAGRSTAFVHI